MAVVKCVVVAHATQLAGPADQFAEFLARRGALVGRVTHPLDDYNSRSSLFEYERRRRTLRRAGPAVPNLALDMVLSIGWLLTHDFDVAVAANNFDALTCIMARLLRRKMVIIFFASDFAEHRFGAPLLDWAYRAVERLAVRHADLTVSNTKRAEGRRFQRGLKSQRSIVVPNCVHIQQPMQSEKHIRRDRFIYVGSLTKEHGLHSLLGVLAPITAEFVIAGDGDEWERVAAQCRALGIPTVMHKQLSHADTMELLHDFDGFGLAPYNNDSDWTYYCSPLKVVEYVACGLPVIMSSVPEVAQVVQERRLGIVYDHVDESQIIDAVLEFDLTSFAERASAFAADHEADQLYDRIPLGRRRTAAR